MSQLSTADLEKHLGTHVIQYGCRFFHRNPVYRGLNHIEAPPDAWKWRGVDFGASPYTCIGAADAHAAAAAVTHAAADADA